MTSLSTVDPGLADYLGQFDYTLALRLGPTWHRDYRQFEQWCHDNLGRKFKDWFIVSRGQGVYTLYARNSKWAMFLALTWVDNLA